MVLCSVVHMGGLQASRPSIEPTINKHFGQNVIVNISNIMQNNNDSPARQAFRSPRPTPG